MKRPKVAFWLSFLVPGAGLVYAGNWEMGLANLLGVILISVAVGCLRPESDGKDALTVGFVVGLAFASGVWADTEARRRNPLKDVAENTANVDSVKRPGEQPVDGEGGDEC